MTLPSPSELRALAEATEREGLHHDLTFVADMARRLADLSEWVEKARLYVEATGRYLADDPAPASAQSAALLARLDEIRGQA